MKIYRITSLNPSACMFKHGIRFVVTTTTHQMIRGSQLAMLLINVFGRPEKHEFFDGDWMVHDILMKHMENPCLDHSELLALSLDEGHSLLTKILSKEWTKDITPLDPLKSNFFTLPSITKNDALSTALWSKLLCAETLVEAARKIQKKVANLFIDGAGVCEIQEMMDLFQEIQTSLQSDGFFSSELTKESWHLQFVADNKF